MQQIVADPGELISDLAQRAQREADKYGRQVEAVHNGRRTYVNPGGNWGLVAAALSSLRKCPHCGGDLSQ